MTRFYAFFIHIGERFSHWFLLAVRLFWGIQFAQTGWGKLQSPQAIVDLFTKVGIPYPEFNVLFVGYVELICGLALAIGFLSRILTLPLIVVMLVALFTVNADTLTSPMLIVKQTPFNFLIAALMVFSFGPGRFSLDKWMMQKNI